MHVLTFSSSSSPNTPLPNPPFYTLSPPYHSLTYSILYLSFLPVYSSLSTKSPLILSPSSIPVLLPSMFIFLPLPFSLSFFSSLLLYLSSAPFLFIFLQLPSSLSFFTFLLLFLQLFKSLYTLLFSLYPPPPPRLLDMPSLPFLIVTPLPLIHLLKPLPTYPFF
jgi:hypothetical protein